MAGRLRAAPTTVPALAAVALALVSVPLDGAQAITRWAPGALLLLALLAVTAIALPPRWRALPGAVRAAAVLLAAFTAWSFLSIAWAGDRGVALEGADRTLLYLVAFLLLALWPQRADTAAWILGAWTGGVAILALVTLLRIGLVADPAGLFHGDRLTWPAGYANAAAATWLMALWPAVTLAASARVPWLLRGAFAAAGVVLADVAMLSLSRGAVLSLPVCALLLVAVVPGRLRNLAALAVIGGAAAAALPAVLDVGPAVSGTDHGAALDATDAVLRAVLLAALAAGAIAVALAALETRRPPSPARARAIRRAWAGVVAAGAAVLFVGGAVAVGDPVARVHHAWTSFKGGYADNAAGNRLTAGLGSNRYDFYRVALDVFRDHPVAGVGADNFFQDYLRQGRSPETPAYPHNVELRTLSQTGLIGTLLLLGAFAAALAAGWRAMRTADALAAPVAGGAVLAFLYWVVHGTTDWFWEWAGLGAPAFALLGLACALAPRLAAGDALDGAVDSQRRGARSPLFAGAVVVTAAVAVGIAGPVAIAGPWLAEREMDRAGAIFAQQPLAAYQRLDRAAGLDPLSARPRLLEGSIALRYGDLPRARAAFEDALADEPRNQYATLELGAIAAAQRRRGEARALLRRAVALAPRDPIAREALAVVQRGSAIDIAELNRRIYDAGQMLTRG